ncbi:ribosomal protein L7/L12 C-terminal domain-containing protein [Phlebopus sp. FC_14]|nr:ribosomal protein L7/L12 C-terminal domain-containing protein [Phlebopus sp. FC_14]
MATRCFSTLRTASRSTSRFTSPASRSRWLATEAAPSSSSSPPPPPAAADPRINRIVDDISGLTLLQAADLVSLLKSRLNIQEISMPVAAAAAAPAASAEEAPAAEEKPKEKTIFNVTLKSFDATAKPKIIREVKALVPNLTLIDAKKFVESVPKVLKEGLAKEEADKLKATFEGLGGVVVLE